MILPGIPILLYHSVAACADERFAEWTVKPQLFGDHMSYLADNGYTAHTVKSLAEHVYLLGQPPPPRSVAITFDDGFEDFFTNALPHLRRTGLTATVFVPTAYIGSSARWLRGMGEGRRPTMTWNQLSACLSAGIELGAHSHTHPELDAVGAAAVEYEVAHSQATLAPLWPVTSFAYPHGYHSARVRDAVARAGFLCACAVADRPATRVDDRFAIPRLVVRNDTDVESLRLMLERATVVAPGGSRTVRRGIWRAVRRARAGRGEGISFPVGSRR